MQDKFWFLKGKVLSSRDYPEIFPLKADDRVINLGSGQGPQVIAYSKHNDGIIGVDINESRLKLAEEAARLYGIRHYRGICASVEEVPLQSGVFDKVIAIGVILCIPNPRKMCLEANRLLTEKGELLIDFPGPMLKFTSLASKVGRYVSWRPKHVTGKARQLRKQGKSARSDEWDPDAVNHRFPLEEWISLVESCGFRLQKSRASTLFPPLHLYGVPKFWFRNNVVHKVDSFLCTRPILKNYGQELTCVFSKEKSLF